MEQVGAPSTFGAAEYFPPSGHSGSFAPRKKLKTAGSVSEQVSAAAFLCACAHNCAATSICLRLKMQAFFGL